VQSVIFLYFNGDTFMTIKIDPKSLLVGAVVAVLVLMSTGIAGRDQDLPRSADNDDSLKGRLSAVEQRLYQRLTTPQLGRFQLDATDNYAVILDTATGQTWRHDLSGGGQRLLSPSKLEPAGD